MIVIDICMFLVYPGQFFFTFESIPENSQSGLESGVGSLERVILLVFKVASAYHVQP